jgi:zinc/manganese transport system permease protein
MSDMLDLMAAPFAACVVLVGIHAYLGMHVIQRKVIFVDLALAQLAALGATFGFLIGAGHEGAGVYLFSLGFALIGAAIFSVSRMRHARIPQEAIIGIVYAVALAMAILVADRAPDGAEHIKETLVGTILWVTWPTIGKTALIYALVGALHYLFRKRFFQISFRPEEAFGENRRVRMWDFLFYLTFAFVITSSVAIAGVLLVFSFLVIPAVIANLFADRIGARLAIGWSVGIVACLAGLAGSYRMDMPSGPAVVTSLGMALIISALIYYIRNAPRRGAAALKAVAGIAAIFLALAGMYLAVGEHGLLAIEHEHDWEVEESAVPVHLHPEQADEEFHALQAGCDGQPECVASVLAGQANWPPFIGQLLVSDDPGVRERALDVLELLPADARCDLLVTAAGTESDPLLRTREAALLHAAGDRRGLQVALAMLVPETPPLARDEAYQLILEGTGKEFGYDPFGTGQQNAEAVEGIKKHLESKDF